MLEEYVYQAELSTKNGCKLAVEEGSHEGHSFIAVRNRNCLYVGFTIEATAEAQAATIAHTGVEPFVTIPRPQGAVEGFFVLETGETFGMMVGPEGGAVRIKELNTEPLNLADIEALVDGHIEKQFDTEHDCSYMIGTYFDEQMQSPASAVINFDCAHLSATVLQYEWEHESALYEYGPDFSWCKHSDDATDYATLDIPTTQCQLDLKPGQLKAWLGESGDAGILDFSIDLRPINDSSDGQ